MLLPIKHYKFNADLMRRTKDALRERNHAGNSSEYEALARLLDRMDSAKKRFTFKHSKPATSFDAFADSGNAILEL